MRADVRLLVADDHPMFRYGLVLSLTQLGFGYVAEAADGQAAVEACVREAFDVVVLDLKMPRLNGFEAAKAILQGTSPKARRPKIIMLSTFDQPAVVAASASLGVDAFLAVGVLPSLYNKAVGGQYE